MSIFRLREKPREQLLQKWWPAVLAGVCTLLCTASLGISIRSLWHWYSSLTLSQPWITALLLILTAVGMEFYARWAHKYLWHEFQLGWSVHKTHHRKRPGAFEANDIFAAVNAAPAIALCAWGFFTPGLLAAACFGAGLGMTLFGMSYMFVHDGLVHKRFPVGLMGEIPLLRRIAAAHSMHHKDKFGGVPYGLFLGPQELNTVGGKADLELQMAKLAAAESKASSMQNCHRNAGKTPAAAA